MSGQALPAREAYALWAPTYAAETAVSALEELAVQSVCPPLAGRSLLDAGCGIGRRLPAVPAARRIVGVDLTPEMLLVRRTPAETALDSPEPAPPLLAAADICALPLRARCFDIVWCRLVLGHVHDLTSAYQEMARVAATGATLIVTDFHPDARAAGHERAFRDDAGHRHVIEHHDRTADEHIETAAAAGWSLVRKGDFVVDPRIRHYYESADALTSYQEQLGLALVLLLVFAQ